MGLIFPAPVQTAEAPKPPVEVVKTSVRSSCNDYREELEKYDWDVEKAISICTCESGGDTNIVNDNPTTGDYSVSLFQINLFGNNAKTRPSEEWLKIPANNISYAYTLYKSGGFERHWRHCSGLHEK